MYGKVTSQTWNRPSKYHLLGKMVDRMAGGQTTVVAGEQWLNTANENTERNGNL